MQQLEAEFSWESPASGRLREFIARGTVYPAEPDVGIFYDYVEVETMYHARHGTPALSLAAHRHLPQAVWDAATTALEDIGDL